MAEGGDNTRPQAIEFPQEAAGRAPEVLANQPRQPYNLQGLLRFAMEATKAEDAPRASHFTPLDEERRKFLEDALKSMSINVVEVLQKPIQKLQGCNDLPIDFDITEHISALDTILDYVDDLDIANDFHKIGGFTIFPSCFACIHPEIRAGACSVLAELCQNNPYCQQVVLHNNLLGTLLDILKTDTDDTVCVKALYAISCNVRENEEGYKQFLQKGGTSVLLQTLTRPVDKLRTKSAFLLASLCTEHEDIKSNLLGSECVPLLIGLIGQERMSSHEHLLYLLVQLMENNEAAAKEYSKDSYNLRNALSTHLQNVKGSEDCLEEVQYCEQLLKIFSAN